MSERASRTTVEPSRPVGNGFEAEVARFSTDILPLLRDLYQQEVLADASSSSPYLLINLKKTQIVTRQFQKRKLFLGLNFLNYIDNDGAETVIVHGCVGLHSNGKKDGLRSLDMALSWENGQFLKGFTRIKPKGSGLRGGGLIRSLDYFLAGYCLQETQLLVEQAIKSGDHKFVDPLDVLSLYAYTTLAEDQGNIS